MLSKSLVYCHIVSNHLSIVILCQITCLFSFTPRYDSSRRLAPLSSALWFVKETRSTLLRAVIRQGDSLHSPPRCDWSRRLAPLSQLIRGNTGLWAVCLVLLWVLMDSLRFYPFFWLIFVITLVVGLRYSIEKYCPFYGTDWQNLPSLGYWTFWIAL